MKPLLASVAFCVLGLMNFSLGQIDFGSFSYNDNPVIFEQENKIEIEIKNTSEYEINQLKFNYGPQSDVVFGYEVSGLELKPGEVTTIALPNSFNFSTPGSKKLMTIECAEINEVAMAELKHSEEVLLVKGNLAEKVVFIETACAKTCSPCLDKMEHVRALHNSNIEDVALVVYSQAPIGLGSWGEGNLAYNGFHDEFDVLYQSNNLVDRKLFAGNQESNTMIDFPLTEVVEDVDAAFQEQINSTYVPVGVTINPSYDPVSKNVNVDVTGEFCDFATGDMRFHILLVQDTVIGPDQDENYAQWCLSSSSANSYGFTNIGTASFGGSPIIFEYPFFQACKVQPNGFYGNAGVINSNCVPGDLFQENFNFVLPDFANNGDLLPIDPNRLQIIVAVVNYGPMGEREVLNAGKVMLVNGTSELSEHNENAMELNIIGNPVENGTLTVSYDSELSMNGDWIVFNSVGQVVSSFNHKEINSEIGMVKIDVNELTNGMYFLSYNSGSKYYTRKFEIIK